MQHDAEEKEENQNWFMRKTILIADHQQIIIHVFTIVCLIYQHETKYPIKNVIIAENINHSLCRLNFGQV